MICLKCGKEKSDNDFPLRSNGKLEKRCKECRNKYLKEYRNRDINKIKAKEYSKKYNKENKEKKKEKKCYLESRKKALEKYNHSEKRYNSLLKYNHSEKRKKYANEWSKNKRKKDVSYKISCSISSQIRNNIYKNNNHSFDILGYDIKSLMMHLEKQFDKTMSWNNYRAYWEIDHIIPLSIYNMEDKDNIVKCWSLENLRPLYFVNNINKKNKIDMNLIEEKDLYDKLPKEVWLF